MERRKFVIGAGALATGSAAAIGTGAFTTVEAERDFAVEVVEDDAAYLALEASDDTGLVEDDGGVLEVDLTDSPQGAEGVNQNAVTTIEDAFTITHQGTQDVGVEVTLFDDAGDVIDDGTEDAVSLLVGDDDLITDGPIDVEVGDELDVTIEVDTLDEELETDVDSVLISADEEDFSG